jgi:AcrR family transcriptional regulator
MRDKRLALKRVREIADAAFTKRGFDNVTIGEIAAQARCSTATIYAAYGSKSELYFEIRRDKAEAVHVPVPANASDLGSLTSLLSYARDRISSMAGIADIQNYRKPPEAIDQKRLRVITRNLVRRVNPIPWLKPVVAQAMKAGLLRRGDAEAVAYVIWTAAGWEAAMLHLLFDAEFAIDPGPIIRKVFTPLVTRRGHAGMSAFLSAAPKAKSRSRQVSPASLLAPDLLP